MNQTIKDYSFHITIASAIATVLFIIGAVFYFSGIVNKVQASDDNINKIYLEIKDLQLDLRITTQLTKEINTKLEILLPNY